VDRWEALFHPPSIDSIASPQNLIHSGKTVLITGAGGCIGLALARVIANANPRLLLLLDATKNSMVREKT
jgi:FlaA1/EpsC-like NDP-sugar epimerase